VATGAERFSLGRLLAVATSIAGVVLVSKSDRNSSDQNPSSSHWILGDILALSSAALYALYVILMKVFSPPTRGQLAASTVSEPAIFLRIRLKLRRNRGSTCR
jgi:drug/metabolite transporter (DMT)-like permease